MPWRTIVATVGVVLATYVLVQVVLMTVQVIAWISIAAFFAVVLAPAVRRVQARVGGRRALATGIVVFTTLAAVIGLLCLFLLPVRSQLIADHHRPAGHGARRRRRPRARSAGWSSGCT